MGLTPATANQVPDHAILDYFNKQAYLGQSFIASTGEVTISTASTETPLLYLANPSTNKLGAFSYSRKFGEASLSDLTVFTLYKNPTGVSGGTAITPVNLRFGSSTTSLMTVKKSVSVSTNGTFIATLSNSVIFNDSIIMLIVDPGTSLLVTALTDADSIKTMAEFSWFEI